MMRVLFSALILVAATHTSNNGGGVTDAFSPRAFVHKTSVSAQRSSPLHMTAAAAAPMEKTKETEQQHDDTVHDDHLILSEYNAKTDAALAAYKAEHALSVEDPEMYWGERAYEYLDWTTPFDSVLEGSLETGDVRWFSGGKLNVAYNAIDRHIENGKGDETAMIFEGDDVEDYYELTYSQLQAKVSQISNALLQQGVKKGDVVTIYMASSCCGVASAGCLSCCPLCAWTPNSYNLLFLSIVSLSLSIEHTNTTTTPNNHPYTAHDPGTPDDVVGVRTDRCHSQCGVCRVFGGSVGATDRLRTIEICRDGRYRAPRWQANSTQRHRE